MDRLIRVPGDEIQVTDTISITILQVKDGVARLAVKAPAGTTITNEHGAHVQCPESEHHLNLRLSVNE